MSYDYIYQREKRGDTRLHTRHVHIHTACTQNTHAHSDTTRRARTQTARTHNVHAHKALSHTHTTTHTRAHTRAHTQRTQVLKNYPAKWKCSSRHHTFYWMKCARWYIYIYILCVYCDKLLHVFLAINHTYITNVWTIKIHALQIYKNSLDNTFCTPQTQWIYMQQVDTKMSSQIYWRGEWADIFVRAISCCICINKKQALQNYHMNWKGNHLSHKTCTLCSRHHIFHWIKCAMLNMCVHCDTLLHLFLAINHTYIVNVLTIKIDYKKMQNLLDNFCPAPQYPINMYTAVRNKDIKPNALVTWVTGHICMCIGLAKIKHNEKYNSNC